MATTTNYSWTTPDDTALVKDGAAAIRSLGTAIDTTVFNNAGAAIAKATVDAKGDLIAGTADNTIARLAVGANGTTLVADSSTATGLKWAAASSGAMTKVTASTFASTTSVSVDGCFTATYANYVVYLTFTGDSSQCNIDLRMRASGVTDTAGYTTQAIFANGSTPDAGEDLGGTGLMRIGEHLEYTNGTKIEFYQPQIAEATSIIAYSQSNKSSGGNSVYLTGGIHVDTTQFDGFELSFGNSQSGTVRIYGLEN